VVAAAVIGYACARLRIVPIVGFLLAGVLIGPDALGIVREREIIDAAAEVGVILLLFTIGIEFSIGRLLAIRRLVLLGGSLQVAGAVALTTGVLVLAGVELRAALFTGLLVSLSSTAIVLKLLGDRGSTSSAVGRTSLGLLIFQDLAVVAMVLLLPVLGESGAGGGGPLAQALATAVAVIVVTLVVARRVMPPVLEAVARACSPEVFLLSVIALCLGTAYLTALAGVSVSLGAFWRTGRQRVSALRPTRLGEVLPLQILFSATFFLSVGHAARRPVPGAGAAARPRRCRAGPGGQDGVHRRGRGDHRRVRRDRRVDRAAAGPGGRVRLRAGADRPGRGLSPAGLGESGSQAFIAATVLLLVATPGLAAGGRSAAARLAARAPKTGQDPSAAPPPAEGELVLVSGWGGAARHLAAELVGRGHAVAVVTLWPDGAAEAEALGLQVVRGDSTRAAVLETAGVERARVVVVGDDEPEQASRIAGVVAQLAPHAQLVVLAADGASVPELYAAGAGTVVLAPRAAHASLSEAVLRGLRPPPAGRRTVVDVDRVVSFTAATDEACVHAGVARPVLPSSSGCLECSRTGDAWVHLRLCTSCGHVGCCDSSPNRHAASHALQEDHPVMTSVEPGESWGWCYLDQREMSGRT
jgi:CPA2 family monovalent cation:H+ antiporter-2